MLVSYPDKRLIQYLKFGFPLFIDKDGRLCGGEVKNHCSEAVTQYLDKEKGICSHSGPS